MNACTDFAQIRQALTGSDALCLAVAGGASPAVVHSLIAEHRQNLVRRVILTGDGDEIINILDRVDDAGDLFEIHDTGTEPADSARRAVEIVRNGGADALVKGHIDSAILLKAILDKRTGIRAGQLLSNITVFESPGYHKLFGITDNAIVPSPDIEQKIQIARNAVPLFSALGVSPVKVALVASSEKPTNALRATTDAVTIKSRLATDRPAVEEYALVVDGPFGYDICVSRSSAEKKGITQSEVAGDADLLLFHDLEAANAVAKAIKFHGNAQSGGLLMGCTHPVLFNSRSDGPARRSNSLLLASILASNVISARKLKPSVIGQSGVM